MRKGFHENAFKTVCHLHSIFLKLNKFQNINRGEIMKNNLFKWVAFLTVFIVMIPALLSADIYLKYKTHSDGMKFMGQSQGAQDQIQTTWMSGDKTRTDMGSEQSVIIRLDQKKIYFLDHQKKTYSEMPLNFGESMEKKMNESMETDGMESEQQQQMTQMMQGMTQMQMSITPTDQTKKIGDWTCKKYIQKISTMMGPSEGVIWATEELEIDPELYANWRAAMMGQGGMFGTMMNEMMEEMQKVKGVPVMTESSVSMMGQTMTTTQELIEYKEGTAPSGYFEIPSGYKKTEAMDFQK